MSEAIITFSEEKVTDQNLISAFSEDLYYLSMDNSCRHELYRAKIYLAGD